MTELFVFKLLTRSKLFKKNIQYAVTSIRLAATLTDDELIRKFHTADRKPRVFDRPHLPGSHCENLPESLAGPTKYFPYILDRGDKAANGDVDEILSTKAFLRSNIAKYGAVVLRGLDIKTATDFDTFSKGLGLRSLSYVGGLGVRDDVEGIVMTASREPPAYTIEPHNEMSYLSKNWATYLWFFCETPPAPGCGGESVLVVNTGLQRELDPEVTDKFRKLGVRYTQYLPSRTIDGYLSWQEVLKSGNKDVVEELLKGQGHSFEWSEDNCLSYWYNTDAFRPHHVTGHDVWFNQAHMNATYFRPNPEWAHLENVPDEKMPFHTYYGDGSSIAPAVLEHVRAVTWRNAIGLQLTKGDVLFIDNMAVQHGRLGYVGDRRLLVSMTKDNM